MLRVRVSSGELCFPPVGGPQPADRTRRPPGKDVLSAKAAGAAAEEARLGGFSGGPHGSVRHDSWCYRDESRLWM